jgi:hypothetical protein
MFHRALACAAAAALFAVSPAFAGFTATTGTNATANTDIGTPGGSVGDSFAVSQGTFSTVIPDTPADPQIAAGDLPNYGYTLSGTITAVDTTLNQATYAGAYEIFYNLDGNHTLDSGDIAVSKGNFNAVAQFTGVNTATLTGQLTQTSGPGNPAFRDLSYGGSPVDFTGLYVDNNPLGPSPVGTLTATLRQNAIAPEPASLAALALGGLVLRRRRA